MKMEIQKQEEGRRRTRRKRRVFQEVHNVTRDATRRIKDQTTLKAASFTGEYRKTLHSVLSEISSPDTSGRAARDCAPTRIGTGINTGTDSF
jgi:hypothetical protein